MSILNTGAPHFKSVMKQHRHANYTLPKVINEFIDNIIKKTDEIRIYTQVDDMQKLQELRVSDNFIEGFDNLDCEGVNNPFNMGHIKTAHDNDSETSEFGVGMKAGALSAANQLNVYTRIKQVDGTYKYVEVICDFIRMSCETDVNASYNPRIRIISFEEYKEQHPFIQGSTLKLSKIRDCIYSKTTQDKITSDIIVGISDTYTRFISGGSTIMVNDIRVSSMYDFFEDPKCEPFTISKDLFILEKSGLTICLIKKTKDMSVWQEFNRETGKWNRLKEHNDGYIYIQELLKNGYKMAYTPFNNEGVCMQINTTFVFYSDKYHTANPKLEPELPEDTVFIYKDDRNYGKQSLLKHNNGVHNYTLHEIDFVSKRLGKDIGITFNKEILMNGNNDLIVVIKAALVDSRDEFTADTSVKKNQELCEKAIKKGLINLLTCPENKLSSHHRSKRIQLSETGSTILKPAEGSLYKTNNEVALNKPNKPNTKNIESVNTNFIIADSETYETETVTSTVNNNDIKKEVNAKLEELKTELEERLGQHLEEEQIIVEEEEQLEQQEEEEQLEQQEEEQLEQQEEEEYNDVDDRRKRTVNIINYLNKSIINSDENVLTNEVLSIFESIFC